MKGNLALLLGLVFTLVLPACAAGAQRSTTREGRASVATITVGPFDLHRSYRSMEGPYTWQQFRVADLVQSKHVELPESTVIFIEGNPQAQPAMSASATEPPAMGGAGGPTGAGSKKPIGLVDTKGRPRELYWFKGMKLIVLDEQDKPLPTAEFICHLNLDVDPRFRRRVFPNSEHGPQTRLMTLTQGQTSFYFPEGFAVPVASDELWALTFQAANRNPKGHRRVKQFCTMEFIRDSDLKKPMKALNWYNPFIAVAVGKDAQQVAQHSHGPSCLGVMTGNGADNSVSGSTFKDKQGHLYSGHWAVPPGQYTYTWPVTDEREMGFSSRDKKIHAVWSHVHPLCSESSLVACNGGERKKIFTAKIKTKTDGGLELLHIENILSKKGIFMPGSAKYQVEATYNNTTDKTQDSMVSLGIFFEDEGFKKPNWQLAKTLTQQEIKKDGLYCGIDSAACEEPDPDANPFNEKFDLYDPKRDGELLTSNRYVELNTTAGKLRFALVPEWAPQHTTQLYKLLTAGAFDNTPFVRYEPGFVLQVATADHKVEGKRLSDEQQEMMRRLPLEIAGHKDGIGLHKALRLTMARDDHENSAVSSFSILLSDAPHLDHNYTVFGYLIPDAASFQTLKNITEHWGKAPLPVITNALDMDSKSLAAGDSNPAQ